MKELKAKAQELAQYGRNGDTMLAHITPEEAALLKSVGGSGTINPDTGLPEFFLGDLLGGLFGNKQAKTAASAQTEAARIAADAAAFKPYAVTTGFGSSYFDEANKKAGYTLDPTYAGFRDTNLGLARDVYDQLGAADPQQMAAQYMAEQQGLLAPTREAEDIALRNQQLNSGRIGLGVSGSAMGAGGTGMLNPEQYQRDLARARVDAQLAANSREQAQADIDRLIDRASGLFQTGAGVEQLGMTPLTTGMEIGGRASSAGANVGQALLQGGMGAAQTNLARGLMNANMIRSAGNAFGGMFSNMNTSSRYNTNPFSQQTNMLAAQEQGMW